MKKYLVIVSVLILAACRDPYEVREPGFEVWTDRDVYTVGEVVRFHIEGNVDLIDFYSGTPGNDYAYHNRDRIFDMMPTVSFRATKYAGNNDDCAALLVTTDFDGNYEFDNVKSQSANWIDISERFDIPPIGASAFFYDAGKASIADLIEDGSLEEGKPIYFAWYCKTDAGSMRTGFQVTDFNLNGEDANTGASGIVASQAQMAFQWVLSPATLNQTTLPSMSSILIFWNGLANNTAGPLKEGYAISAPISLENREMNMGYDSPVVIKSIQTENMIGHSYIFDRPGEYEVTFVGYNVNYNGRKDVVKTIRLTIEE